MGLALICQIGKLLSDRKGKHMMDLSRRRLLQAGLAAPVVPHALAAASPADAAEPIHRSLLWYTKPASVWTEALPIGNGRLGAMLFGGIKRERFQLNEDTLWSGGPYSNVNPQIGSASGRERGGQSG